MGEEREILVHSFNSLEIAQSFAEKNFKYYSVKYISNELTEVSVIYHINEIELNESK